MLPPYWNLRFLISRAEAVKETTALSKFRRANVRNASNHPGKTFRQQTMNPSVLRGSLRDRLAPCGTNNLNRLVSTHSGSHKDAGRDEA